MDTNNLNTPLPAAAAKKSFFNNSALRAALGRPEAAISQPRATGGFFRAIRPEMFGKQASVTPAQQRNQGFFVRARPIMQAINGAQPQQPAQGLGTTGNFQSSGALSPSDILRLIQLGQR